MNAVAATDATGLTRQTPARLVGFLIAFLAAWLALDRLIGSPTPTPGPALLAFGAALAILAVAEWLVFGARPGDLLGRLGFGRPVGRALAVAGLVSLAIVASLLLAAAALGDAPAAMGLANCAPGRAHLPRRGRGARLAGLRLRAPATGPDVPPGGPALDPAYRADARTDRRRGGASRSAWSRSSSRRSPACRWPTCGSAAGARSGRQPWSTPRSTGSSCSSRPTRRRSRSRSRRSGCSRRCSRSPSATGSSADRSARSKARPWATIGGVPAPHPGEAHDGTDLARVGPVTGGAMHAHVNIWQLNDAGRSGDDAVAREVSERLAAQPGFRSYTLIRTGEREVVAVTVFDSASQLEAATRSAAEIVERKVHPLAAGAPERRHGEVVHHRDAPGR
jgi:heme-degrading monooxygenase HmoA